MPPPLTSNEPRLSGSMVMQHLEILRASLGAEKVEAILQDLPPEDRIEITQTIAVGWVSFETMEHLYATIALHTGRDAAKIHREVVRVGVERNARTMWRLLLRMATDRALMTRAPLLFSKGYSGGRMSCVVTKPGHATLTVTEWPNMREYALRGLQVGVETILTVAGRREPQSEGALKPNGAVIEVAWRV